MSQEILLSPELLRRYLAERELLRAPDRASICALGGGVSNLVFLIEGPEGRWVAKQSLGKLRVRDDWRSDRERIFREAEAIRDLYSLLGANATPELIHLDRKNFLFIMTAAPPGSVVWKESLLNGQVDFSTARQAGKLLAAMIASSQANPDFRKQFADRTVFDQLRIDPYYRTTALRHPDVASMFDKLIRDSWGIQTALVHGDYSPKNMLAREGKIFLIDFEVVHWGDPAFDSGFLLNHLLLKAIYQPQYLESYFQAAREFWDAARQDVEGATAEELGIMTFRHLGGLMLARMDGKSPVEYIQDEGMKDRARRVAKRLLLNGASELGEVLTMISQEIHPSQP